QRRPGHGRATGLDPEHDRQPSRRWALRRDPRHRRFRRRRGDGRDRGGDHPMRRHDRGFSLIEAMMASIIMLIGLLGLAGLQIVGMRANNIGKRMSQASLLAQDLAQNMQIWAYADNRLQSGGP